MLDSHWNFLVPIRLDLEHDHTTLVDSLLWDPNSGDPVQFAHQLVSDLNLPSSFIPLIVESINVQLSPEHYPHFKITSDNQGECKILIKLDVTIGSTRLRDQFEYDVNNPYNSPELISTQLVKDLGLSPYFIPAISHSIREQIGRVMLLFKYNRTNEAPLLPQLAPDDVPYRWPAELPAWTPIVETDVQIDDVPTVMPPSGHGSVLGAVDEPVVPTPSATPAPFDARNFRPTPLDSRKYNLGPQGPLFPHDLLRKIESGETALDIAQEFIVTLPTIRKRLEQANIPRWQWFHPAHGKEIIQALDAAKGGLYNIAETVSVDMSVVRELAETYKMSETDVLGVYNNSIVSVGYILPEELFMKFHATNTPMVSVADAVKMPLKALKRYAKKLLPDDIAKTQPYKVKYTDPSDIEYLRARDYNVIQIADVVGFTLAELNRIINKK
ncbi:hypothetical protein RCL1_005927 [Eukaryota sp. TZLM3-RCL]